MKKRNTTASTASTAAKSKTATMAAKPAETAKPVERSSAVIENYFEIDGEQIKVEDVVDKICAENDGFQSLRTYFNFSERRCYYVADGKAEDKFVEF